MTTSRKIIEALAKLRSAKRGSAAACAEVEYQSASEMYQVIQGISAQVPGRDQAVAQIQKYCETLAEISKSALEQVRTQVLDDSEDERYRMAFKHG